MLFKLLVVLLFVISCGKPDPAIFFEKDMTHYQQLINPTDIKSNIPASDKTLYYEKSSQHDFDMELTLYNDNKFSYNMPTLGEGTGSWKYEKGHLNLFATRPLFDMHMRIDSLDKNGHEVGVSFTDRFGPKTWKLKIRN